MQVDLVVRETRELVTSTASMTDKFNKALAFSETETQLAME